MHPALCLLIALSISLTSQAVHETKGTNAKHRQAALYSSVIMLPVVGLAGYRLLKINPENPAHSEPLDQIRIMTFNVEGNRAAKLDSFKKNCLKDHGPDLILTQEDTPAASPFHGYQLVASTGNTHKGLENRIFIRQNLLDSGVEIRHSRTENISLNPTLPPRKCAWIQLVMPLPNGYSATFNVGTIHLSGGRYDDKNFAGNEKLKEKQIQYALEQMPLPVDHVILGGDMNGFSAHTINSTPRLLNRQKTYFSTLPPSSASFDAFIQYQTLPESVIVGNTLQVKRVPVKNPFSQSSIFGGIVDHFYTWHKGQPGISAEVIEVGLGKAASDQPCFRVLSDHNPVMLTISGL